MDSFMHGHEDIPFRVRVGVTGHRRLNDQSSLGAKVREVLDEQIPALLPRESRKRIGSSPKTQLKFSVLSPLAEGADRLVAREVLKTPDAKLDAVLPFDRNEYLRDFATRESRDAFDALLARARRTHTLISGPLSVAFPDLDPEEARRRGYEGVGRYVVDHCDVLIALWDGNPPRGKGGTAEIVEYARSRKRPIFVISAAPPYAVTPHPGGGLNDTALSGIDDFNKFPIDEGDRERYIDNMDLGVFENPEGKRIADETRSIIRQRLLPYYVRASRLAKDYQRLYLGTGSLVYSLSVVAIASVAVGTLVPGLAIFSFGLEFVILVVILCALGYAHRKRAQKKWIESRFLAERIRSGIFLAAAGIEASPIEVPPYMGIAHKPDDWMVRVFDEIWDRLGNPRELPRIGLEALREFIRVRWIQDQLWFHRKKKETSEQKARALERYGNVAFFSALVAAGLHLIALVLSWWFQWASHAAWFENGLIFVAIVAPAVGAAMGGIRIHREFSRLEKRSANMEGILGDLEDRVGRCETPRELEMLLRETEHLMLRETQDWLMLMKFVILEKP